MKKFIMTIAIIAALTLTGCNENREMVNVPDIINSVVENTSTNTTDTEVEEPTVSTSSTTTTTTEVEEPTEVEDTTSTNEEPTTSSTPSFEVATPATSSTTTSSSTTSSSKPTEKPVEEPVHTHTFTKATCTQPATCTSCGITQGTTTDHNFKNGTCKVCGKADPNYVAPHNCDIDGHVWEVTYTTTEPKWCQEIHNVYKIGFDTTMAEKYLNTTENTWKIFKREFEAISGKDATCGSATITVEVWGTETYKTETCKVCGYSNQYYTPTINPIGEWQFVNGVNPWKGYEDCSILFWDPYNIPQETIEVW